MLWENLRCQEFPEAVKQSGGVCVIPMGATEKHGLHLGVGIDTIVVEEIARQAAEIEPVVVFPAFRFGQINNLQHYAGSVCLSAKLMLDYLQELCREIARSGFRKILILNGHGGNGALLGTLSYSLREEKKDYVLAYRDSYRLGMEALLDAIRKDPGAFPELLPEDVRTLESYFETPKQGGHADFDETICLLAVRPEGVDLSMMDQECGESTHRVDHLIEAGIRASQHWFTLFPNHHAGTYHPGANERLGKALLQMRVADVAHAFKVFKEDTTMLAQNAEWNSSW